MSWVNQYLGVNQYLNQITSHEYDVYFGIIYIDVDRCIYIHVCIGDRETSVLMCCDNEEKQKAHVSSEIEN